MFVNYAGLWCGRRVVLARQEARYGLSHLKRVAAKKVANACGKLVGSFLVETPNVVVYWSVNF